MKRRDKNWVPWNRSPCLLIIAALTNDFLSFLVSKRPAEQQGQLGQGAPSQDADEQTFSAAKRDYILKEVAKPAFLDNGRARGSTHRRQDMTDVQMRMIHGPRWAWTCEWLEKRFNELSKEFDEKHAQVPSSAGLDEQTLATIIQMVVKEASKGCF